MEKHFDKALKSLSDINSLELEGEIQNLLENSGVDSQKVGMIKGKYFLYVLLPEFLLEPIFTYQHILEHKDYKLFGAPKLHFCACEDVDVNLCIAKESYKNSFDFKIIDGSKIIASYKDMTLDLCPKCQNILSSIAIKDIDIFSTTLISLLSEDALKDEVKYISKTLPINIANLISKNPIVFNRKIKIIDIV